MVSFRCASGMLPVSFRYASNLYSFDCPHRFRVPPMSSQRASVFFCFFWGGVGRALFYCLQPSSQGLSWQSECALRPEWHLTEVFASGPLPVCIGWRRLCAFWFLGPACRPSSPVCRLPIRIRVLLFFFLLLPAAFQSGPLLAVRMCPEA